MWDSHKRTPCKFCPSLLSESSGDCPKVSIWGLRWGLRALEQEQMQPKTNPDQSQAAYEVGFCLVLVPFNNLNLKLFRGLPLESQVMSARTQALWSANLQQLLFALFHLMANAVLLLKPERMGTGVNNPKQTFLRWCHHPYMWVYIWCTARFKFCSKLSVRVPAKLHETQALITGEATLRSAAQGWANYPSQHTILHLIGIAS